MNYLVLKQKGNISILQHVPDGTMITPPFKSWALKSGKQILFVDQKLHKILKGYHMHGTYQKGAWFGYAYDDMLAILTDYLGPDDEARYEQLQAINNQNQQDNKILRAVRRNMWLNVAACFVVDLGMFVIKVAGFILKFVGIMFLLTLLLHLFNKHKR